VDYQAIIGDILTVEYNSYQDDGTMFNTTEIYEPLSLVLGDGIVLPEWEEAFQGRCAGEKVMMVVTKEDEQYFYQATVDVITRVMNPAPISHHHFGILAHDHGRCPEAKTVKIGSMVTMNSTTRIPNLIYLKYPKDFPKSNTPVKIGGKGVLGMKVSESIDTFRAGVNQMVDGWDYGIADACEGETRKIMMSQAMAYGDAGVFRTIPSQAPIVMDVDIMKVENFDGIFFPEDSESRLDFSKVDFFLGKTTTAKTVQGSVEHEERIPKNILIATVENKEAKNVSISAKNTPQVSVENVSTTTVENKETKNVLTSAERTLRVSVENDARKTDSESSPTMTIDIDYLSDEENFTTIDPTTITVHFVDEPSTVTFDYEDVTPPPLLGPLNITDTKSP